MMINDFNFLSESSSADDAERTNVRIGVHKWFPVFGVAF